jgi:hypothetical protein
VSTNALTKTIARGAWGTVEAVILDSGRCPADEFLQGELDGIREGKKGEEASSAKARFLVLFQIMANCGRVSPKRHKSEMAGLWAFRHEVKNQQIRFPCFQDGKRWILTHGFVKKAKKGLGQWPKQEEERAKQYRDEYHRRKLKSGVAKPEGKS